LKMFIRMMQFLHLMSVMYAVKRVFIYTPRNPVNNIHPRANLHPVIDESEYQLWRHMEPQKKLLKVSKFTPNNTRESIWSYLDNVAREEQARKNNEKKKNDDEDCDSLCSI